MLFFTFIVRFVYFYFLLILFSIYIVYFIDLFHEQHLCLLSKSY